jgi:hypothetical protein
VKNLVYLILICLVLILSCEKENGEEPNSPSDGYIKSFISLTTEEDSLVPGESTKITALVDGDGVKYYWTATQGDILGSGKEITYVALACTCGQSVIVCSAKAGSNEISRSIIIYILDE